MERRKKRKVEEEEGEDSVDSKSKVMEESMIKEWKVCKSCNRLALNSKCLKPCPRPPLSVLVVPSKLPSHIKLFEMVTSLGGYSQLTEQDWKQVKIDSNFSGLADCKEFYEQNLYDIERKQATEGIRKLLKADTTTIENIYCGICKGCLLKEDCGECNTCEEIKGVKKISKTTTSGCEKRICIGDSSFTLPSWLKALISSCLWGVKNAPPDQDPLCHICKANIRLFSEKLICNCCNKAVACKECCVEQKGVFYCQDCIRDNSSSLSSLEICFGCGDKLTTKYKYCYECGTKYCFDCKEDNLKQDSMSCGGGFLCFYCQQPTDNSQNIIIGVPSSKSTRQLNIFVLPKNRFAL